MTPLINWNQGHNWELVCNWIHSVSPSFIEGKSELKKSSFLSNREKIINMASVENNTNDTSNRRRSTGTPGAGGGGGTGPQDVHRLS